MFSISFDSYCTGEVRGDSKVDGLPSYCQEKPSKKVGFSHLVVDNFYSMPSFYHAGFESFQECCESLDVEWTCRDNWLSYPYFVFLFGGASGSAKKQDSWHPSVQCINNKKAEYKIATTTALLSFVAFFSFLPAGTAFTFVDIFPVIQTNQYFIFRSTQSLAQLNSLLNPILYCFRNPQFWKVLKEMVGIKGNTDFQPWLKRTRHNQEKITNYSLKDKRRVEKHKNLSKSKSFSEGFLSDPNRKMEMLPRRSLSCPIPRSEARATFSWRSETTGTLILTEGNTVYQTVKING